MDDVREDGWLEDGEMVRYTASCPAIRNQRRLTRRARVQATLTDRRVVATWGSAKRRRVFIDAAIDDIEFVRVEKTLRLPSLVKMSFGARTWLLIRLRDPEVNVALQLSTGDADRWRSALAPQEPGDGSGGAYAGA